ncbi:hypothetical protein LAZ67_10001732 [Cordylochernes scorpioides]|uniref:Reverse transcriptase n=1 Tax=Cordylochernes scorpioides TaxID=51811 RepID=A0ABY6KY95_9ARAC|nr:hypothetical protein LAZ67_10001732 [Cordylochernes scorpioides]
MVYLEYSPEFTPVDYIKALENKLGKSCVVQLEKHSDKGALFKALPYQKKAEKITISGLPYVIEDADIIRTLRPYCQVVSIAPAVNSSGGYTWLDLKNTAFILMNNGKKSDLPKKIVVTAKGGSALAYLEYGFRCSKCYRMGHKRMNCPRIIREENTIQPSNQKSRVKPAPAPNTTAAASSPAALNHPAPVAVSTQTFSTPPTQETKAPETEPTTKTPETNVTTLDSVEDLCLGYRVEVVPASGARGFGIACIFSSGVQIIRQRVLAPGEIDAFDVTIRGIRATFINCHLSHAHDERLQQLQAIAAAAVNEDAWILGDLNISEESASDIASGSVEALGELLDRANLVDAAAIFDAAHLPARISSCGSRVDASRLDRVLLPSRLSNRVTRYWSLYYKNSDHCAVLLQIGEAPEPRPPCIASMLRSRLVVGTVETLLNEAFGNIEDMQNAEIWRRGTSSTTFYDSAGQVITGPAVRDLAFANLKERFSHPSCSPEDIDGFLRGFTLRVTIEESDPLHRYGIGEEEIVTAIGRLPTGEAAGWDELPCELFRGFKDFFASALRRVFEASQLCGALPSSMRRSEMSLIAKPHGGLGLAGLRPLSLPTTDYRVLSGYAVPERTPAWNISRVADEVATACREETPLEVVATDLESAFDTLDRGFLMSVILSVGLPPVFVGWVLLLYAGAEATVILEGIGRTPLFHMLNGVRQGCADSAAFFTISTGPLLLRLEQLLGRDNFLAYADDIVLLMREDGQLEVVKKIFEDFRIPLSSRTCCPTICDSLADLSLSQKKKGVQLQLTMVKPCGRNRGARDDHRFPAPNNPHCPPHAGASTPGCTAHHPCAFSGHNADVAVRLALHALPHPAHPASARESCIACGSGDLSLAHRHWSCRRIRPVIVEAFTIIQRPPDPQSWIFGHDLEDDALAIMASAKTRIYKHFLGLEMRRVQEDPLLVWRSTLSRGLDLFTALRPYGQVTSIIQKMMQLEDSCWSDARREAFITLRDGVKISHIPARLDVKFKGVVTHFYVTYDIKCSLCHKQGHKGENCPRKTGVQEDKLVPSVETPAVHTQGWAKPPSTSNTMPAAAPTPADYRPQQTSPTAAKPSAETKAKKDSMEKSVYKKENTNYANLPISGDGHVNSAAADSSCLPTTASSADGSRILYWAEAMEHQDLNNEPAPFTKVERKRRRTSASQRAPTAQSGTAAPVQKSTNATRGGFLARRRPLAQEIKATRKNIAEARAQQASGTVDQCVYVECCPEFSRVQYVLALDKLVGGENIIQLTKMNGHVLVGLTTKALAERLIEEGFEIEDTLLKTYPFRKRAERLIVTNLPFFVDNAEIIAALKPYGRVISIVPLLVNVAGFTMKDGRRELFILLNEGVKLERLPTRLNINHKGEIRPAFMVYGVKCSRCQRQGHRRANCPLTPKRPADAPEQAPSNTGAVNPGPAPTTPTADPPSAPIPATSPENKDGPCHVSPASPPPTAAESVEKSSPDQSQDPLQDQRDSINLTPLGKSTKTKIEMK